MQQIDKDQLKKILDKQYQTCLDHIIIGAQSNIQKLSDYGGDMLDIKTEITIGHSMEGKICQTSYADYYRKGAIVVDSTVPTQPKWDKIDSAPKTEDPYHGPVSLDKLFWPELDGDKIYKPGYRTSTVTAPKHKKKYLIKLNNNLTQKQCKQITQEIAEQQFIAFNNDVISDIITLDVE